MSTILNLTVRNVNLAIRKTFSVLQHVEVLGQCSGLCFQ